MEECGDERACAVERNALMRYGCVCADGADMREASAFALIERNMLSEPARMRVSVGTFAPVEWNALMQCWARLH